MNIRAVFIDMDGTLLNKDNKISKRNYEAIQLLLKQDIEVFLATGRQMDITFPYHQELGLKTPMICLNGAAVYDWFTLDPLLIRSVKVDQHLLYNLTSTEPFNVIMHTPEGMYCKKMDSTVERWVEESRKNPVYVGDLKYVKPENVMKYSVISGISGAPFAHYFEKNGEVIRWRDGFEIVQKGVSKWSAIEYLLNKYNIRKEEAAAIGHGPNDIQMLKAAGTGIAMGNASKEIKKAADFVTLKQEEDGLADFIEKHLIKSIIA
ncbi:Cof-type HAD-IIB family hydrolase [Salipaludibacillus sp. CUR1]|uniref:Cof-type HAD-IIB family hydrolase n=1 Tax=Salipaludibacillus sp. CUR1 TaxID=2820003 RepID=UPI001E381718|nr:Cof-type HAD-IIB family hydrolase [Salipaludibacillus sp. CUR1]MCE7794097.1 Cof-type HAD-IIB family hydrolase [Salipaludibacillus sp. CUR1]